MTALGIIMVVSFCVIVPAIFVCLALYTRNIALLTKKSTAQNFILKAPIWYSWLAFLGFVISFFVIVALSTFWQATFSLTVYLAFAGLALLFAIFILAQIRTKIEFCGETIIKTNLFRKKIIKYGDLTTQKPINSESSIVVYSGDKRAFIVSEMMIGYEFISEYLKNIPLYNFAPKPKSSYIKNDDNE